MNRAINAFIMGMAHTLELGAGLLTNSRQRRNRRGPNKVPLARRETRGFETDRQNLAGDWNRIGEDMGRALSKIGKAEK